MKQDHLKNEIEDLYQHQPQIAPAHFDELIDSFLRALEEGSIRAASQVGEGWEVQSWVKKGILLGFKYGRNQSMTNENGLFFYDKHTYPIQPTAGIDRNIRIVPGGSSVRRGAFIGTNVTMMPPMYVNVGAFIDEGSMIDSHALVGSCAQVGKGVHLSAAAQLGGVLEPINATPVIIEDDCMIGGNVGIYEGTQIGKSSVIGSGVILTKSTPVYDLINEQIIRANEDGILKIPENAVVIPGSRQIKGHAFSESEGLAIQTPLIIKYRDDRTDAATQLEQWLR